MLEYIDLVEVPDGDKEHPTIVAKLSKGVTSRSYYLPAQLVPMLEEALGEFVRDMGHSLFDCATALWQWFHTRYPEGELLTIVHQRTKYTVQICTITNGEVSSIDVERNLSEPVNTGVKRDTSGMEQEDGIHHSLLKNLEGIDQRIHSHVGSLLRRKLSERSNGICLSELEREAQALLKEVEKIRLYLRKDPRWQQ